MPLTKGHVHGTRQNKNVTSISEKKKKTEARFTRAGKLIKSTATSWFGFFFFFFLALAKGVTLNNMQMCMCNSTVHVKGSQKVPRRM